MRFSPRKQTPGLFTIYADFGFSLFVVPHDKGVRILHWLVSYHETSGKSNNSLTVWESRFSYVTANKQKARMDIRENTLTVLDASCRTDQNKELLFCVVRPLRQPGTRSKNVAYKLAQAYNCFQFH